MKKCIHNSLKYGAESTLAFFSHFEFDIAAQGAVPLASDSDSVLACLERVWRTVAV